MTRMFENAIKSVRSDSTYASSQIPSSYDIGCEDMTGLADLALDGDLFKALSLAFTFGFVMGNRATISRQLKRL